MKGELWWFLELSCNYIMRNINELVRIINGISYDDNKLETKIEYLRNCVKDRKNIGIDLIDILDKPNVIDSIHRCAERELKISLDSYSGIQVNNPEIVFISLVLIGMLYYDGSFYESVRKNYKNLYLNYSEQKIEGLIRTLLNTYLPKNEDSEVKTRIINIVLAGSIVPSHYLGSFFDFIYDIYKLNFDSDLPENLYEEFQFVYEGLHNIMCSESDTVQVNVTKKTYKLIKSTKQLIINPSYNDAVINLSIIVAVLIDKYIWGKEETVYNPYLKSGYDNWISTINKDKEYNHRRKTEQSRSRWEPEFVLIGEKVYIVPPTHRIKATYDYQDIRILVKNDNSIIYDNYVEDIREIIGGYQIKSTEIQVNNPIGRIEYQLIAKDEVIYCSKNKLHRDFIVFDMQGKEITNNKDFSGTVIFCTKNKVDKLILYTNQDFYYLSSYNARIGDAVFVEDNVFNFSEIIKPGVFGEKYDGYLIAKDDFKFEVFKSDIILVFESEFKYDKFEIIINNRSYRINEFEYSVAERKGFNKKYSIKLDISTSGIYKLRVNALYSGKKTCVVEDTQFAIDKNLNVEYVYENENTYFVSIESDLLNKEIFDEICINNYIEDWLRFSYNGNEYIYFIPFEFPIYRLNNSTWKCFSENIWIGDITSDTTIDIYGCDYDRITLLACTGKIIEEITKIENNGIFSKFLARFLYSYKSNYDFIRILLYSGECIKGDIICYFRCVIDEDKTSVTYDYNNNVLVINPYFYGQGNIYFKIFDDKNNNLYTSSFLKNNVKVKVNNLNSFINYRVRFFEKGIGLLLQKERNLAEIPIIFYNRNDLVGKNFKVKEVEYDQLVRGEFLRKKHYFNTTFISFTKMKSGNEFEGIVFVKTSKGKFLLNNVNPVDIEICSDVIEGVVELYITKDGDGLLMDFNHHGIMNSMDDDKAVDIYSYSIDMKEVDL